MEIFVLLLLTLLAIAAGLSFVWGAPIFGVPLLLLALIVGGVWKFALRVKRDDFFQQELKRATHDGPEFTDRDKETLTHR